MMVRKDSALCNSGMSNNAYPPLFLRKKEREWDPLQDRVYNCVSSNVLGEYILKPSMGVLWIGLRNYLSALRGAVPTYHKIPNLHGYKIRARGTCLRRIWLLKEFLPYYVSQTPDLFLHIERVEEIENRDWKKVRIWVEVPGFPANYRALSPENFVGDRKWAGRIESKEPIAQQGNLKFRIEINSVWHIDGFKDASLLMTDTVSSKNRIFFIVLGVVIGIVLSRILGLALENLLK